MVIGVIEFTLGACDNAARATVVRPWSDDGEFTVIAKLSRGQQPFPVLEDAVVLTEGMVSCASGGRSSHAMVGRPLISAGMVGAAVGAGFAVGAVAGASVGATSCCGAGVAGETTVAAPPTGVVSPTRSGRSQEMAPELPKLMSMTAPTTIRAQSPAREERGSDGGCCMRWDSVQLGMRLLHTVNAPPHCSRKGHGAQLPTGAAPRIINPCHGFEDLQRVLPLLPLLPLLPSGRNAL